VLLSTAILAFLSAGTALAIKMGWAQLTPEQFESWLTFYSALVVLAGLIVRQFVTPYIKDA
jgi:uncharacterized membrane protein